MSHVGKNPDCRGYCNVRFNFIARWKNFERLRLRESGKGSSDPSHFIFQINVEKSRIRHKTTLNVIFKIDSKSIEVNVIQIQSRFMSDPTLSDIDFSNKIAWVRTTLKF